MNRKALKTCVGIVASALGLLMGVSGARAQTAPPPIPGDWGGLRAYNNAQGRNGDPLTYNPGRNNLRWTAPATLPQRAVLTLDNTDIQSQFYSLATTAAARSASIDDPLYNAGSFSITPSSGVGTSLWRGPATVDKEAGNPYILSKRVRIPATDTTTPPDRSVRDPAYLFTESTPSLKGGGDPTLAADPNDLRYVEWTFTPPAGPDRNYAIYTYLPVGATYTSPGAGRTQRTFPQRFFVYKIFFGNGASYTDVIDTEAAGSGFVRLGNGGFATQRVFPFNNISGTAYPIRVRLYNTVPRYDDGSLAITGSTSFLSDAQEFLLCHGDFSSAAALARTPGRLVYADAVRLRPQIGEYRASPVTQTYTPSPATPPTDDGVGGIDARVTVALNEFVTSTTKNVLQQSTAGTVISYQSNPDRWPLDSSGVTRQDPLEVWRYSLADESANAITVDDNSADATNSGGWASVATNPNHVGTGYLRRTVVTTNTGAVANVTYSPKLDDGDYNVYVYLGGSAGSGEASLYARAAQYLVYEGATLVDTVTLNQDQPRGTGATTFGPGWVRLGKRRYHNIRDDNDLTNAVPLKVIATNYTTNAADGGRLAFADAVRFVGIQNSAIDSTPVHANVKIAGKTGDANGNTKVVVVADESGRIHCLDATGNGDGTTTEYWSYPSTPDPTQGDNWKDPNIFEIVSGSSGIDGTPNFAIKPVDNQPTATMPASFDLSSAAVAHVATGAATAADYLYIASTNGRVYCIDMTGRGDYAGGKIGTTKRVWTYPDDFNPTAPTDPIGTSDLGPTRGSIVFGNGDTGAGTTQTVYVPAYQGRIYALDALGAGATRKTSVRWRYPEADQATLPNVIMTPTLFKTSAGNGRLYFGTLRSSADDSPGRLYCLDAATGDIVWQYNGGTVQNPLDIHDVAGTLRYSAATVYSAANGYDATTAVGNFGAFVTGLVAVPGATLNQNRSAQTAGAVRHVDEVYGLNNNLFLYAFNAETGVPITYRDGVGTHRYATNDLNVLSDANLTFTFTKVLNRNATYDGTTGAFTGEEILPTIIVPSADGRMREAFARAEDYNAFSDGTTSSYVADGLNFATALNSAAASNNATYLTDAEGALYALDDTGTAGNNLVLPPSEYGVTNVIPPNDPRGKPYRNLKIRLVNRAAYNQLKSVTANGSGNLTWYQVNDPANPAYPGYQGPTTSAGAPYSFEWGETAYVLVYGFPYTTTTKDSGGNTVVTPAPTVNITLSTDGKTVRQVQVDSRSFVEPPNAPDIPGGYQDSDGNTLRENGYAVIPFTFNSAGSTALPPGAGRITATISSSGVPGPGGATAEVLTDTRPGRGPALDFLMANPLAVEVVSQPGPTGYSSSIGNVIDASDPMNAVNGSPNIGASPYSQLLASAGSANHGGTATARVRVFDRSLMALVRPEGLNNVRLQRSNLERQGGVDSAMRPLNPTLYPSFEDLGATTFRPNRSLDYPSIGREQVRAVKDPGGNAENPLLTAVTLVPPTSLDGFPITEDTLAADQAKTGRHNERLMIPTPFEMTVDVPRYQPPVSLAAAEFNPSGATDDPTDLIHRRRDLTGNANLPQGYFGKAQIYVDSNNDQTRNSGTGAEAYRSFNYAVAVLPQASILVGSPTVDLGSLAGGTGYTTHNPAAAKGDAGSPQNFDPWTGAWSDAYQPIIVRNDGNVNLLDLRVAKGKNQSSGAVANGNNRPWGIYSDDNDPLAALSAGLLGPGHGLVAGDLWSNIDQTFAPDNKKGGNLVILQKPRVTDRTPTELAVNPYPRANANIPTNGSPAGAIADTTRFPAGSTPKVAVSVPLGFPVGNYSTQIRVIENRYDSSTKTSFDDEILNLFNNEYEAYSDPITLTFKIRETRMTNRTTPKVAPVIDDPSLFPASDRPVVGSAPFADRAAFRNGGPAAMRTGTGALVVAWPSDRVAALANGGASPVNPSLIYLAGLDDNNAISLTGTQAPADNAPLWDLNQFAPGTQKQWFTLGNGGNGYPGGGYDALFGGSVINGSARFDAPSFPASGNVEPLQRSSTFNSTLMGFVGDAQLQTATGRLSSSRVFLASVTNNGATVTAGAPVIVPGDIQTAKGKPSVLQLSTGALVFYSETSAGQSGITVSRLRSDNTFSAPLPLNFGEGFSSVFSPSASARNYLGAALGATGSAKVNNQIVELSFAGKLRGRPNAEVYLGRLRLDTAPNEASYKNDLQLVDSADNTRRSIESGRAGSPFVLLPEQTSERMVGEGAGVYRARGVLWNRNERILLTQTVGGVPGTSVLVDGTGTVERQSGLIVYDSRLGGKVYLDPELGTVKFVGSVPSRSAEMRITYTPTFLRVTPGGVAGYSAVNGLWDSRLTSEYNSDASGVFYPYWFRTNGVVARPTDNVRNDRYFFAYARGAAGNGVTARPFSTTLRLGVRLPTRIATDNDGNVLGVQVTGNTRPYQVDPANGRIYFQAEDEDRNVSVSYTGVDEATNQPVAQSLSQTRVSFVLERAEAPIAVDEAANDSALTAFLDPFTFPSGANARNERPPLVWLFYTSTRAGNPDVYFQTIAPRFLPFAK